MAKEQMTEDIIMEKKDIGEVKIASDVVSVIAALAATEVEGVNSMAGMNKFGVKNTKGVRVLMNEGRVHVDMMIIVKYGYSIPKISKQPGINKAGTQPADLSFPFQHRAQLGMKPV